MTQSTLKDDICYHHFSLTFDKEELPSKFSDVKFVLVAGCEHRVENQAKFLSEKLFNGDVHANYPLEHLTKNLSRFTLYKIGPVLMANHGMGPASMSIALHELFLMCQQASVINKITLVRFGTCGGIGVEPGTVCITNRALDPMLQDFVELKICLKIVRRECIVDQVTSEEFERLAKTYPNNEELGSYEVKLGATIGTSDFYEEQGRTNGSICDHSQEDKMNFLDKAREAGVINMEMESNHLAAMCHKLKVSFGVICVALNNRLRDDTVKLTREQMAQFERRLFWINLIFIREKLSLID